MNRPLTGSRNVSNDSNSQVSRDAANLKTDDPHCTKPMIRWIAFDAVGTLIYPEPDVATSYAIIGQKYGSRLTAADLRSRFSDVFVKSTAACLPTESGDVVTNEELELQRWQWIVDQMLPDVSDRESCFQELYDHFARPESWRIFPDAAEAINTLSRQSLRLAIASNFDQRLRQVCRGFPEFQAVERIVVSTEVYACKPSARFYQGLLQACKCGPDELWMVGDEFDADVAGPEALGIRATWVDRNSAGRPSQASTIRLLTELVDSISSSPKG